MKTLQITNTVASEIKKNLDIAEKGCNSELPWNKAETARCVAFTLFFQHFWKSNESYQEELNSQSLDQTAT